MMKKSYIPLILLLLFSINAYSEGWDSKFDRAKTKNACTTTAVECDSDCKFKAVLSIVAKKGYSIDKCSDYCKEKAEECVELVASAEKNEKAANPKNPTSTNSSQTSGPSLTETKDFINSTLQLATTGECGLVVETQIKSTPMFLFDYIKTTTQWNIRDVVFESSGSSIAFNCVSGSCIDYTLKRKAGSQPHVDMVPGKIYFNREKHSSEEVLVIGATNERVLKALSRFQELCGGKVRSAF